MTISGKNLIAGQWIGEDKEGFTAIDAVKNEPFNQTFVNATYDEVELAISSANKAFCSYSQLAPSKRAEFLRAIGTEILALGNELIHTACAETGLPEMRIQGERGRTIGQLEQFATLLDKGEYEGIIDFADENRQPLPKPDTRLGYLPIGVVGVFAASNFPLAFSTAGGDTASALAAGCPVVMKAHAAHPGTAELVARAIHQAIKVCDIHAGVFSLIQGKDYKISSQIVTHPFIKAVGFTGSERVGMILKNQINERPEPIPFYGELGSVNPQFLMPNKVEADTQALAEALVASMMMGQGQFCTSPGLWVYLENQSSKAFETFASDIVKQTPAGVMLTPKMASSYQQDIARLQSTSGVATLAIGLSGAEHFAQAALFATDFSTFKNNPELHEEVFGSCALLVKVKDFTEMLAFVELLKGNLTASIHANDNDLDYSQRVALPLVHKVGRLIYNQMPTGVEVCASMNHGGPFPASTDVRTTSVGGEAIKRFQRPICYQNMPKELLPAPLLS